MSTTVTITANDLNTLLSSVLPFTGRDFPILDAVRLCGRGDYLTATATDRYRLGCRRLHLPSVPEFEAAIPAPACKSILRLFKPDRRNDPQLALTFDDTTVTVTAAGGLAIGVTGATATYALEPGEYPKIDHILLMQEPTDESAPAVALNPHYLADFRHVAVGDLRHEPIVLTNGPTNKAVGVRIGSDFIGAIMPVTTPSKKVPAFDADSWTALLDTDRAPEVTA